MTRPACLIPAWNEAARIGGVLSAVAGHPDLGPVTVIDDGSTDGTADVARAAGVAVLRTPGNLGKTRALLHGLRQVAGDHVVLLDADLVGLDAEDVGRLVRPVAAGAAGASISLRGNAPRTWRLIGLDYISGERVLPMRLLRPRFDDIEVLPRFGFEVFLNRLLIADRTPLAVVGWPGVSSPSKASKQGLWRGIVSDARMMGDIFRTISPTESLSQIAAMRRLRVR